MNRYYVTPCSKEREKFICQNTCRLTHDEEVRYRFIDFISADIQYVVGLNITCATTIALHAS